MKIFCSFSEAIREGAKLSPQCFGELEINGSTCAIGAGIQAIGLEFDGWPTVAEMYPYLADYRNRVTCPAADCEAQYPLYKIVTHLNDGHFWMREQIADWLESEEGKLGFVTLVESESSSPVDLQVVSV